MKMRLLGFGILLTGLLALTAFGQTNQTTSASQTAATSELPTSYVYEGAPVDVTLDLNRIAVKFTSSTKSALGRASLSDVGLASTEVQETGVEGWTLVTPTQKTVGSADVNARVLQALESPSVEFASPVLLQPNGGWMVVTPDVLLRVRPEYRKSGGAALATVAAGTNVIEENFGDMAGAYKLHFSTRNGFDVLAAANRLAADPSIEWAEPDMLATLRKDLTPNDPGWPNLWGLNNTGQGGGVVDMDMDCDLAWDVTTGSPTVKVLVLDDGAELTHPDLNIGGGADFTGSGTGGGPGNTCDNHATAVSGCVAAIINNSLGTIGSAPGCKVLSAKFTISNVPCDGAGTFQFSWLVNALAWGQGQGARVSSNSNGLPYSSSVAAKYQDTYNAGMVHFASAGNDGIESIGFPGSLSMVNAVSAINRYGGKASFSSYGAEVSFAAPGQEIYTTDRTGSAGYTSGSYATVNGTSFSAPYAAGVAALVLSVEPGLTPAEVEDQLRTTATDLGAPGFDIYFGYGLLNAYGAVAHARLDILADVALGTAPMTVNFTGSTARPATSWSWTFGDGGTSTEQNPTHEYLAPGSFSVSATIEAGGLFYSKTVPDMISIYEDTLVIGNGRFDGNNGRVDVSVRNFVSLAQFEIPFSYAGSMNITFDSVTVTGLRSSWMTATILSRIDATKRAAVLIRSLTSERLTPGSGAVTSLWFHRTGSVTGNNPVAVANWIGHSLSFSVNAGTYVPVSIDGSIVASCCQGIVGDANGDLQYEPTIGDVSTLISHLFIDGVPLDCYLEADVNQSGGLTASSSDITIGDVSALIDYLFVNGTPLPQCL